jgi:hypothetical protein
MEANPKFVKLLESLREATARGTVQWEETVDEKTFRVTRDYATVQIYWNIDDISVKKYYYADLLDQKGRVVESLEAESGSEENLLKDLFELAQRNARHADDLLDRMIADLESNRG